MVELVDDDEEEEEEDDDVVVLDVDVNELGADDSILDPVGPHEIVPVDDEQDFNLQLGLVKPKRSPLQARGSRPGRSRRPLPPAKLPARLVRQPTRTGTRWIWTRTST